MITLCATLFLIAWSMIVYAVVQNLWKPLVKTTVVSTAIVSLEEIEEAKKYAILFGIDNEADNINIPHLLNMGRKVTAFIGYEKAEEIHTAAIQAKIDRYFYCNPESRSSHHLINNMMKAHRLVAASVPSFITTIMKTFGGDKDGEPNSSICTATR